MTGSVVPTKITPEVIRELYVRLGSDEAAMAAFQDGALDPEWFVDVMMDPATALLKVYDGDETDDFWVGAIIVTNVITNEQADFGDGRAELVFVWWDNSIFEMKRRLRAACLGIIDALEVRRLTGRMRASNRVAQKIACGVGFRKIGVERRAFRCDRGWRDMLLVEALREDLLRSAEEDGVRAASGRQPATPVPAPSPRPDEEGGGG